MKRLYRDRWDKKISGVCGGLGQFFGIDPTILRLVLVMLCIFTGVLPLLVIYIIAWMLIPLGPPVYIQFECTRLYRSVYNRKISGICGGIANFLKVDGTIIRIIFLVTLVLTGFFPLLITYFIGTVIIPENPDERNSVHNNF